MLIDIEVRKILIMALKRTYFLVLNGRQKLKLLDASVKGRVAL